MKNRDLIKKLLDLPLDDDVLITKGKFAVEDIVKIDTGNYSGTNKGAICLVPGFIPEQKSNIIQSGVIYIPEKEKELIEIDIKQCSKETSILIVQGKSYVISSWMHIKSIAIDTYPNKKNSFYLTIEYVDKNKNPYTLFIPEIYVENKDELEGIEILEYIQRAIESKLEDNLK